MPDRLAVLDQGISDRARNRLSAHCDLEPWAALPSAVEKHLPGRGCCLRKRHLRPLESGRHLPCVERRVAREDHEPCAAYERQIEIRHRKVERERRQVGHDVGFVEPRLYRHVGHEVDNRPVLDLDALGRTRGAGGVDDVRELVWLVVDRQDVCPPLPISGQSRSRQTTGTSKAGSCSSNGAESRHQLRRHPRGSCARGREGASDRSGRRPRPS